MTREEKQAYFASHLHTKYSRDITEKGATRSVGPYDMYNGFNNIFYSMDRWMETAFPDVEKVNDYIELIPLSQITDEDSIEVAKILGCSDINSLVISRDQSGVGKYNLVTVNFKRYQYLFSFALNNQGNCLNLYYERYGSIFGNCLPIEVWDYLRSKGYALPFRPYSVDQLVEMGWLKLKTT